MYLRERVLIYIYLGYRADTKKSAMHQIRVL